MELQLPSCPQTEMHFFFFLEMKPHVTSQLLQHRGIPAEVFFSQGNGGVPWLADALMASELLLTADFGKDSGLCPPATFSWGSVTCNQGAYQLNSLLLTS